MKTLSVSRSLTIAIILLSLFLVYPGYSQSGQEHHGQAVTQQQSGEEQGLSHEVNLGAELPLWSVIPFIGILLSIAIFPLVAPHFWHHHFGKVSAFWALVFAIPFLFAYHGHAFHEIVHIYLIDYIPFIILLWALFTIAGGILVEGALVGTPIMNLIMLIIGTFLASLIGTTGASMVLIRPMIRMNKYRKSKVHLIIFFIFLVSNIGGSLTPLGDPPLFLGFLHGVPFFWTLNIFPHMALVAGILLTLFFLFDSLKFRQEGWHNNPPQNHMKVNSDERFRIRGLHNLLFLFGVISGVLFSGLVHLGEVNILGVEMHIQNIIRDLFLVLMGILSLKTTAQEIREGNEFGWFPIVEVAKLFAGIFMTIIPALAILKAGVEGELHFITEAVKEPWHYFWITGSLSSFLDNAPTYLTFLNSALGQFFAGMPERQAVASLIAHQAVYLKAISAGAVFFGAMTYIGNAPNFMVKSIKCPASLDTCYIPCSFCYPVSGSLRKYYSNRNESN